PRSANLQLAVSQIPNLRAIKVVEALNPRPRGGAPPRTPPLPHPAPHLQRPASGGLLLPLSDLRASGGSERGVVAAVYASIRARQLVSPIAGRHGVSRALQQPGRKKHRPPTLVCLRRRSRQSAYILGSRALPGQDRPLRTLRRCPRFDGRLRPGTRRRLPGSFTRAPRGSNQFHTGGRQ